MALFRPRGFADGNDEGHLQYYPNLALSALRTKDNQQVLLSSDEANKVERFSYFTQKDDSRAYPVYSLYDIYKSGQAENFKDKVVFIGESGTLIHDSVKSPITGEEMP